MALIQAADWDTRSKSYVREPVEQRRRYDRVCERERECDRVYERLWEVGVRAGV